MKGGSMPYWVNTACAQPAGTGAVGKAWPAQLAPRKHAHHSIDTITALAPAKNIRRCGALAITAGNSASAARSERS